MAMIIDFNCFSFFHRLCVLVRHGWWSDIEYIAAFVALNYLDNRTSTKKTTRFPILANTLPLCDKLYTEDRSLFYEVRGGGHSPPNRMDTFSAHSGLNPLIFLIFTYSTSGCALAVVNPIQ